MNSQMDVFGETWGSVLSGVQYLAQKYFGMQSEGVGDQSTNLPTGR